MPFVVRLSLAAGRVRRSGFAEDSGGVLQPLSYREWEVLRLRFRLDDGHCRTLDEVGRIFRVIRERIRQIEAKAFRKLQYPCRSRELAEFLD